MRLGAQGCEVVPGSLAHRIYGSTTVAERHRHRYEVNNHYLPRIEAAGLAVGARAKSATAGDLVEMVELPGHPWFFGCQFHPEFTSNPRRGHPLFISFVQAALAHRQRARGAGRARGGRAGRVDLTDARAAAMKLCGYDVGLDRRFFLIAGPCVIESRAAAGGRRGRAEGHLRVARHPVHLQVVVRQGQPQSRCIVPRPRHGRGPAHPRRRAPAGRGAGAHRRARHRRDRHGRRASSTCCRRPHSCAARPTSSRRSRPRASRSTSRRGSSWRPRTCCRW